MHKVGSLPTLQVVRFSFQPRRQQSGLGSSFLAGLQICIIPNEAVPEMLASYSRKLECIMQQHRLLGVPLATSSYAMLASHRISNQVRDLRFKVLHLGKSRNCPLNRLSDGIERKTVFLWHSLELLCARDTFPPKAIVLSSSETKEHYELSVYQCAGYKVCINMCLKTKSKARNQKAK